MDRLLYSLCEQVKAMSHLDVLQIEETCPMPTVLYQPRPKARNLENPQIDWMFAMAVIEPAQTNWLATTVIVPKKWRASSFCVAKGNVNPVSIQYL